MGGKTELIRFRVEPEIKKAFDEFCKNNYTTSSQKLYSFVHQSVKYSGKKLSLNEFKEFKK